MLKVFVPNLSNHNFADAKRYGELIYVTKGEQAKFGVNSMARVWTSALKQSNPEDYILITSLNIICSIGCAVFAAKHKRLNLLLWRNGRYMAREIILSELEEMVNE